MWVGSELNPLCASANEESGLLVNNAPLTQRWIDRPHHAEAPAHWQVDGRCPCGCGCWFEVGAGAGVFVGVGGWGCWVEVGVVVRKDWAPTLW